MPTPKSGSAGRIVRFGMFEVDLAAGELRKGGARIRLQEQPFQVLAVLLERPGEVVTREDVRQRVWPADTFVDFDHSLNTAINKIRDALGDSAASPQFVETLAKRGYRFIAPVQKEESSAPAAWGERLPVGQNSAQHHSINHYSVNHHSVNHPELELPLPHRGVTRGLFALIQLMYLIFYVIALFRLREVERIADSFLPGWGAFAIVVTVLVTAGVGIPLRFYLLSAVAFDYARLKEKFRKLFPVVLLLDELWAVAPFLLMERIGLGAAFAATAGLLYLPFSERTLLAMAYPGVPKPSA